MFATVLRYLIYTFLFVANAIRIYKTMQRNNWNFREYILQLKRNFAIAAVFIAFSIGYGWYKLNHLPL